MTVTLIPSERRRLAWIAGAMLAAATPGLAFGAPGTPLEIELGRSSLATVDFGDARLGGTENRLAIRGPSMPAGEGEFRWALDYAYQRYEYQGLASRNRDLHRLELPLSWHGDARHAWTLELRPVVASSSNVFKEIWSRGGSDDLMLHGRVTRVHEPAGEGWGWRLGAARDDAFGQERSYPVVAVLHEFGRLRAAWGWPETQLSWQATPRLDFGAGIGPAGARWHVVSDERDGAEFDYEVRAWRGTAVVSWRQPRGWRLSLNAGLEFGRRHRFEDDLGARVNRSADDARFLELALGYRW